MSFDPDLRDDSDASVDLIRTNLRLALQMLDDPKPGLATWVLALQGAIERAAWIAGVPSVRRAERREKGAGK